MWRRKEDMENSFDVVLGDACQCWNQAIPRILNVSEKAAETYSN
jgi:hypothetical protein